MKLKNTVIIILSLALAGTAITGCGETPQLWQDAQQDISMSISQEKTEKELEPDSAVKEEETKTAEKSEQTETGYEDNFAVDSKTAKEFAEQIKDAAAKKDLEALAALTAFPVYVGLPDVKVVETKEDFLKLGAEAVFTEELLKSIETADIENLQPSMAGFSVSDGGTANILFNVVDGALAISGINY